MAEEVPEGTDTSAHIEKSAVRSLNVHSASLEQSAVQQLAADTVTARQSALAKSHSSTLEMRESAAAVLFADYVKAEDSTVGVLIAPRVSGNVRAIISLPVAFAFGFGYFFARRLSATVLKKRRQDTSEGSYGTQRSRG